MRLTIVNPVWTHEASTPEATLERFHTLTGWAAALVRAGAAVQVCQRFHAAAALDRDGVSYRFVADSGPPKPSALASGAVVALVVGSMPADVVHLNGLDLPRLTRAIRRALPQDTTLVVQDHGGFDPEQLSYRSRRWMRWGLRSADALLVASAGQIDSFRRNVTGPGPVTIRDVMEASTTLRVERPNASDRLQSILWVGRLNANKDPLTVLEGFRRFAGRRHDLAATLTYVYGSAELEGPLREAIGRDAILGGRVSLAGTIPPADMSTFYAAADAFVLGSHHEGSGYAALEALACGVVPVLTDIPSFRAITDDGRIGALWTPGDPASLAVALERVAALPLQRAACRSHFEQHFSWDAIGPRALAIYEDLSRHR